MFFCHGRTCVGFENFVVVPVLKKKIHSCPSLKEVRVFRGELGMMGW